MVVLHDLNGAWKGSKKERRSAMPYVTHVQRGGKNKKKRKATEEDREPAASDDDVNFDDLPAEFVPKEPDLRKEQQSSDPFFRTTLEQIRSIPMLPFPDTGDREVDRRNQYIRLVEEVVFLELKKSLLWR